MLKHDLYPFCGGVWCVGGGAGNEDVDCLVLTGYGIAVSVKLGVIG